ncbi:MAG: hypothetical protein IKU37_04275, partial [Candidatus Gastranaerophilales bacterium]|nr:hypothetical protein [Candidatus Gastranaerophilales bacterium]
MNEKISKLRDSISSEILHKVQFTQIDEQNFVPIRSINNAVFVAIKDSATEDDTNSINQTLKPIFNSQLKFLPLHDNDFADLKSAVKLMLDENKSALTLNTGFNKQLGQMFIEKGYITDLQLIEAIAESKRNKVPVGSTLFKLGHITLEQLKEVLQLKTGMKVVTNDDLSKQDKFIGLLPEEFIKSNQVVPLFSNGREILLGVVKPLTSKVLQEIIFLTGQNPKQLLMTHYEFQNSMETFFSEQKKETERIIQKIEEESADIEKEESLW